MLVSACSASSDSGTAEVTDTATPEPSTPLAETSVRPRDGAVPRRPGLPALAVVIEFLGGLFFILLVVRGKSR